MSLVVTYKAMLETAEGIKPHDVFAVEGIDPNDACPGRGCPAEAWADGNGRRLRATVAPLAGESPEVARDIAAVMVAMGLATAFGATDVRLRGMTSGTVGVSLYGESMPDHAAAGRP